MNKIYLSDMNTGDTATIDRLLSDSCMRRRLQDIGLIEGTCVECIMKSPAGDPIAYQIRGAVIALRKEDAENILILV